MCSAYANTPRNCYFSFSRSIRRVRDERKNVRNESADRRNNRCRRLPACRVGVENSNTTTARAIDRSINRSRGFRTAGETNDRRAAHRAAVRFRMNKNLIDLNVGDVSETETHGKQKDPSRTAFVCEARTYALTHVRSLAGRADTWSSR